MKRILSVFLLEALFCCLPTIVHRTLDGCTADAYNPICSPIEGMHQNGEGRRGTVGGSRTAVV